MNHPLHASPIIRPELAPHALPLRAVQRLGHRTTRDGMYIGLIIALIGHVAAVSTPEYTTWMMHMVVGKMNHQLKAYFDREQLVDLSDAPDKEDEEVEEQTPEPDPVPEPDIADEVIEPPPIDPAIADQPDPEPEDDEPYDDPEPYEEPAAQAAEAGDILTTDGEIDLTGDGFEMYDNDGSTSRATGYTGKDGRKKGHVKSRHARSDGKGNGPGKGPPKPRPKPRPKKNLSRKANVVGGIWNCPFPAQSNLNQIDKASVVLTIAVSTNGRPTSVVVSSDPGYGFGAQARRCAMSSRYMAAKNKAGKKIPMTIKVRVRFNRS